MSELDAAIHSEDAEARRRAVRELARSTDGDRTELLTGALGDPDWRVRKEAVGVATEVAEGWGLLPALVDGLCQGENVGLRNAALEVFERLGPRAANALLVALPGVPEGARKFLVAALGFAGGAGVDKLAELSNDEDPNTAQAALEALARIGGPRAEEALRGHLRSEDPVQRLAALEGLERLEATVELDEIRPLLDDRLIRRSALRLLGFGDDPAVVPVLLDALHEEGAAAAHEAALALGRLLERGGPSARALSDRAPSLDEPTRRTLRSLAAMGRDGPRRAATWVLLLARDPRVLGAAAELAADDRLPPVALAAIRRWGVEAIEPLLGVAGELAPRPRAAALEMAADLAQVGEPPAATIEALRAALRKALASDEPVLAAAAADALGRFGEPGDPPALVAAARRFPDVVARPAGRALERLALTARDAVAGAVTERELDGPVGAALLPAVAALGGAAATDLLQATLNADDPRARRAAVMALPRLGGARAVELAGFALADEDVDVQTAAVMVLGQLTDADGAPLGVEHLRVALRAGAEPVVAAAARAVGANGDRGSLAALRELVSEGRPGVAVAAMESLRMLGDPALDELLVEALGQSDEELVKEALRAIASGRETPRRAPRIALALEHAAWDVRQLAATLLGETGGPGAREALAARLEGERDAGVRAAIERALAALPAEAEG
ncbi:MAG TPA: HEAT repeat domain-containing protein [Sandaracinaceae bacterium LLY-WYZ-13_1]|nr:HEAT repeat domain-containing protein [Sandaracinaceae bacterium LLY-WYZ-13_1]